MVWGSHHISLFRRACFKSLTWPKNYAAIKGSTWNIYTKSEHVEEIAEIFKSTDLDFDVRLIPIEDTVQVAGCGTVKTKNVDAGVILLNGLRNQIYSCMKEDAKCLLAPPDTLFSDGTVSTLLEVGQQRGSCVAIVHPRVLPSILDDIEYLGATSGVPSNAKLVSLSFERAHDSWKYADIMHEKNNSYIGGISWRRLSSNLYSVNHRLPTCYLLDFTANDWTYWWGVVSFGALDHRWPGENLIRQGRYKLIGSSDAAFACEITDWNANVPPELPKEHKLPVDHGLYHGDGLHHLTNKHFEVIFRGE